MNPPQVSRISPLAYALILALVVSIIGAVGAVFLTRPDPVEITILPPPPTGTPEPSATPVPPLIYIVGAVAAPGLYTVEPGIRVETALSAAGGALPNADLNRVNLAALVRDGDQIVVPAFGETPAPPATPGGGGQVHVNTATLEELDTLPGIGEATARAIIEYREINGPFTSLADLDAVSGIGERTLQELAPLVVFD